MIALAVLAIATAGALHVARGATAGAAVARRLAIPRRRRTRPVWIDDVATRVLRGRRDQLVERALPDALDAVGRGLRSGASLRQAIDEAAHASSGPLADDLERLVTDVDDGLSLADGLRRWSATRPLAGVRLAAAALAMGADTGGASAQAVDGVATTLRTNLAIIGEVRALSSQARLSALVIVLAPVAFTFFAASTDGRTAAFLFGTPAGLLCLAVGLGLDAVGWLWMRRITGGVA